MVFVDADESDVDNLIKFSQPFGHAATNFGGLHFALKLLLDGADDPLDQFLSSDFRDRPLSTGNIDALQDFAGVKSLPGTGSFHHTQRTGSLGSFHG